MKTHIKNRLLFFWLSSVFISIILSGEVYKYMLNSFYESNSKERVETLHKDMQNQKMELLQKTEELTKQFILEKELQAPLFLISKYETTTSNNPSLFGKEKLKLAHLIKNFADNTGYKNIILYDKNRQVISYYLKSLSSKHFGIVNHVNNTQSYLDSSMQSLNQNIFKEVSDFFKTHPENLENKILFDQDSFIIDYTTAIKFNEEIIGYINVENYVSLLDISKLTNKKSLEMIVVYDNKCPSLNIDLCHLFEKNHTTWIKQENTFFAKKELTPEIDIVYKVSEELLNKGQSFINRSQSIVFLTILPLLSLGILIFVKLNIANPISILLEATQKIKLKQPYNDNKTLQGEFRQLSKTFESLSHEILHRQLELEQKNKLLEESISDLEEYNKALNESSIISKGDLSGNITYVNETLCQKMGYTKEEIVGRPHNIFRHPDMDKATFQNMWKTILEKKIWKGIVKNLKKNKESVYVNLIIVPILDTNNQIKEFIALRQDVTDLINSQQEIQKLSYTDSLTGLGNRIKLITDTGNTKDPILALVNIDSFKEINDFYGLSIGDKTIKTLAKILQKKFRDTKLYRVHADEFALLFEGNKTNLSFIEDVMQNSIKEIQKVTILFGDIAISLNLTVGISDRKDQLISSADLALKTAKKEKQDILIYTEMLKTHEEYKNNIEWNTKLKNAIKEDRIKPFYQAIYNNSTKKIEKYEALIRLIDEDGKEVSPFFFLEIAKKTKQYASLTQIMVQKSFEEFKDKALSFSINLSINDILDKNTHTLIVEMIEKYNFGDRVVFEIVESEGFENFQTIEDFIQKVKSYGAKIAIDDFGTGYSNFEYLMKLKADYIKIDGSLIKNIDTDHNAYSVVETIVLFAKKNNLKTVAEFVSSKSIYEKVCELGIDYSQGFFIEKPKSEIQI